jgi:hypothetical protein
LLDALVSPIHPGPESLRARALIVGWCVATLSSPLPFARRLIAHRYRQER